jgi:conjugal transfer pilus assembly protein TraV
MNRIYSVLFLFVILNLTACSLTGLDSSDKLACKAPDGVSCMSTTGVYANSIADNLPGQRSEPSTTSDSSENNNSNNSASAAYAKEPPIRRAQIPGTGTAIRSAPRVLRLWIAPWEDSDGDLHDQFFVYLTVDPGRWVIEHQRSRIQQEFTATTLKGEASTGSKNNPTDSKGGANAKP